MAYDVEKERAELGHLHAGGSHLYGAKRIAHCALDEVERLRAALAEAESCIKADGRDSNELMSITSRVIGERNALRAEVERLNQMLRETGYGQGQIDSYAAECERAERAEDEVERLRAAVRMLDGVCEQMVSIVQDYAELWSTKQCSLVGLAKTAAVARETVKAALRGEGEEGEDAD